MQVKAGQNHQPNAQPAQLDTEACQTQFQSLCPMGGQRSLAYDVKGQNFFSHTRVTDKQALQSNGIGPVDAA